MSIEIHPSLLAVLSDLSEPLFIVDGELRLTFVNHRAGELLGKPVEELKGALLYDILPEENGPQWLDSLTAAMTDKTMQRCKVLSPMNGDWVNLHMYPQAGFGVIVKCEASPLQYEELPHSMLESAISTAAPPAMQLSEKELLLDEVLHRVKNNFQMILSLLDLQYVQANSPETRAFIADTRDRINAIALAHKRLCELPTEQQINLGDYLEELTRILESMYCPKETNLSLDFRLHEVQLDPNRAMTCGLLVNEAVTNSLKHAFPDCEQGEIQLHLSMNASRDKVRIAIVDDGKGIPETYLTDPATSLGMRLMRLLTRQLDGEIRFHSTSTGTQIEISFPL